MGTFTAAGDLGMGLGAVIMGVVVQLTSYPTMFLCLALVAVISLGYFHHFMKDRNLVGSGHSDHPLPTERLVPTR